MCLVEKIYYLYIKIDNNILIYKLVKNDLEILEKLLQETSNGKVLWTLSKDGDYFYCKKKTASHTKILDRFEVLKTDVTLIFLASDNYSEDANGGILDYYGYVDLYLQKNTKKAVFLKRYRDDQEVIQSILSEISKKYKIEK